MHKAQHLKTTLFSLGLIGMASSLASSPVLADEQDSNVRLLVGQKRLDSDDWNTLDRQNEIGMIFDIKKTSWPVSIAFDVMFSGEDKNKPNTERGYTSEQHLGIRKIWTMNHSTFHPYLGGGVALIQASYEKPGVIGSVKEDDNAIGAWIGTGADWHLSPKMSLGIDIRYSQADVTIFNKDLKAGGLHTGITLGYRW